MSDMKYDSVKILMAELLFPHVLSGDSGGDVEYYEDLYPPRNLPDGAAVTRLGPSPTGFIHLGNLYTAFMNQKLANETEGICYLRIEDTDNKREVKGAVGSLISSLNHFGIKFDEGVDINENGDGTYEKGDYGPYFQSSRKEIYHTFVRKLILEGKAYPCFLTEEEIEEIRANQERKKQTPGIYGAYAKYRAITPAEAGDMIAKKKSYVIRLNAEYYKDDKESVFTKEVSGMSENTSDGTVSIIDGIRGKLTFPQNEMDVVILKSDGIPTYHFAHVVDDHLMRTTHVIRGEEWISSLPIHVALFKALGFNLPEYCHSTVLMKIDGEKKRKLSKRKDPELSLGYYREEGYHPKAILEYLLTVINSNFEEWRAENPDLSIEDFNMTTDKMGVSGILFDLEKLKDISKDVLVKISAEEIAKFLLDWSRKFDSDMFSVFSEDNEKLLKIIDLGRDGAKPRKDFAYAKQIRDFVSYYYDECFKIEENVPENIPSGDASVLLKQYLEGYKHDDDRTLWFDKIRELAVSNGYAAKPKEFKKEPDKYKGHVGDVSTVIRLAIVGRTNSPDIYEIQQILGEECTRARISSAIETL